MFITIATWALLPLHGGCFAPFDGPAQDTTQVSRVPVGYWERAERIMASANKTLRETRQKLAEYERLDAEFRARQKAVKLQIEEMERERKQHDEQFQALKRLPVPKK